MSILDLIMFPLYLCLPPFGSARTKPPLSLDSSKLDHSFLWIILESSFLSPFAFHFRHLIPWQASFFFYDARQLRAVCSQFSHEKKEVMKRTGTSMNSIVTSTRRAEFLTNLMLALNVTDI